MSRSSFPLFLHARGHAVVRRVAATLAVMVAALTMASGPALGVSVPHHVAPAPEPVRPLPADIPGVTVERAARHAPVPARPIVAPRPFATSEGIELWTPSARPVLIGFHEAAGHGTRVLTPIEGQVLDPRGRGTAPTSAVDVALEVGEPVRAVVTGTVVDVAPYALYGRHPDVIVVIAPDSRPDLRVRMLHIDDIRVVPGQRVTAGLDVVAGTARLLPVSSQVDRYIGRSVPHLHVEITGP